MATILLADEPSADLEILATVLRSKGHEIIQAADEADAVRLAKATPPDLVISDVILASMDGYQLVRQIRSVRHCQDVRFAFYTEYKDIAEKLGRACDVSLFLSKPCDPEAAGELICAALNGSGGDKSAGRDRRSPLARNVEPALDRARALVRIGILIGLESDPIRLGNQFCEALKAMIGATSVSIETCDYESRPHPNRLIAYADEEHGGLEQAQFASQAAAVGSQKQTRSASRAIEFPVRRPGQQSFRTPIATERRVYGWLRILRPDGVSNLDDELVEMLARLVAARYEQLFSEGRHMPQSNNTVGTELEDWLAHRAEALEAENKDLKAFSYSVSHDLRSPLQSIVGFTHILIEDYSGKVDRQGRACLEHIRGAASRMSQLIDDLLKVSTAAGELVRERVNISLLGEEVADELRLRDPARKVEFAIEQNVMIEAHPGLLREVLENLLGNAWKFTSRQAQARIELGSFQQAGQGVTVFVRDNGVGFDMCKAKDLFNDFRRFHPRSEFEGTGVGLANVKRVIQRHKGKVWADAEVGKGATFYFLI